MGRHGKDHGSSKAVDQFDKNNNFIQSFESIVDAGKHVGICPSTIGKVANGAGKSKTAGGYIWKFRTL